MHPLGGARLRLSPVTPSDVEDVLTPEPSAGTPVPAVPRAVRRAASFVGQIIARRYRIDELVATGSMGAVYRGHHLSLKKRVAIKILLPETKNLPVLVARFEREAIAGAHVIHPNVVVATDFGELDDGSTFLVLEYIVGKTLFDVLALGRMPAPRAVHIARQIAAALGAAHAKGVVHRDVKPGNVMLAGGHDDLVKLIDFGFAKVEVKQVVAAEAERDQVVSTRASQESMRAPLTAVGVVFGTIAYLAPEAALGMDWIDARSDLYALGIILYEMLTGVHPFAAAEPAALFAQQRFQPPPPFAVSAPGVAIPPALEAIVMRLLDKDPDGRYPSSDALIEALDALGLAAVAPLASVPAPPLDTSGPISGVPPAPVIQGWMARPLALLLAVLALGAATVVLPRLVTGPRPAASFAPSSVVPASDPTAHGEPTPPVDAPAPAIDPAERARLRERLVRELRARDSSGSEAALFALHAVDPGALHDPELIVAVADLATVLERAKRGDRIFDALAADLGQDGIDALYQIVATKGLSSGALRAASLLRRPEVIALGSAPLQIAFALRDATCSGKLALLDRAVREGDERALAVMETQGSSCFERSNRALNEATVALRDKLQRGGR